MITDKVLLRVYVAHIEEMQQWKVDTDMDIAYLINAFAEECDKELTNVLLMRDKHIPGLREVITIYLHEVQVYILDCIDEEAVMSLHTMHSAVMWQRAKHGSFPWGTPLLPGQIAERLAVMPTNHDVVRLLEAAQAHTVADGTIIEQMTRIMMILMEVRGHIMTMTHTTQLTQHVH